MKASSRTETGFSQTLLNWVVDRISQIMATIHPEHPAALIAAKVAASGNPAGA